MRKWRVVVREIIEYECTVEANDEQHARRAGEALWEQDQPGPHDYFEVSAIEVRHG